MMDDMSSIKLKIWFYSMLRIMVILVVTWDASYYIVSEYSIQNVCLCRVLMDLDIIICFDIWDMVAEWLIEVLGKWGV